MWSSLRELPVRGLPSVLALYSNGMSEVSIGAVDDFDDARVEVVVMAYDWQSDTYRPVRRRKGSPVAAIREAAEGSAK